MYRVCLFAKIDYLEKLCDFPSAISAIWKISSPPTKVLSFFKPPPGASNFLNGKFFVAKKLRGANNGMETIKKSSIRIFFFLSFKKFNMSPSSEWKRIGLRVRDREPARLIFISLEIKAFFYYFPGKKLSEF